MEAMMDRMQAHIHSLFDSILATPGVDRPKAEEALEVFSTMFEELRQANLELVERHEAMLQARQKILEEQQKYQQLFEFAPDAYLVTDGRGVILQANQAAAELLGVEARFLTGKPLSVYLRTSDRKTYLGLLTPPRRVPAVELLLEPRGRPPVVALASLVPVIEAGRVQSIRWLLRDITQRKAEQAALAASEDRFRTVFAGAPVGMFLVDREGRFVDGNTAFFDLCGYTLEELQGSDADLLFAPADRPVCEALESGFARGEITCRVEKRILCKNEDTRWTRLSATQLLDIANQPIYQLFMAEDITPARQVQAEVEEMRRRLLSSGENERLRLSQELHDGPIQDLMGAVFQLNETQFHAKDPQTEHNLKEAQDMLKQVAGKLRAVCGDLRPPTLSNLGLERSILGHVEKLQASASTLRIDLELEEDGGRLSEELRLALFRIYQQCISNITRHAQASEAAIRLHIDDQSVVLEVEDNGVGFEPPEKVVELMREGHYGLAGIRERAEALSGSVEVRSAPGQGTTVRVVIPR